MGKYGENILIVMIDYIKKLFVTKNEEDEVSRIISYYNKRLMNEMQERQKFEKTIYEKMCKYRDKLIEHGLYEFEE